MDYYLISTLLVLVSSLLIPSADSANPLYTLCSKNYTKSSTTYPNYANNLNNIFRDLKNNASKSGFGSSSFGQEYDKAFGLFLCRGDMKHCGDCIKRAALQLNQSCPSSLEAITWYDNCYLKYSNDNFFRTIDSRNTVIMWNTKNASEPKVFYNTTMALLEDLSQKASATTNKLMFASGSKNMNETTTIYGMAQCSRDLSPNNCSTCLDTAVKTLPRIIVKHGIAQSIPVGGRTLKGSCIVRYETYEFLKY